MKKQIKINLGSGSDYRQGWINVDADKSFKTDLVFDLSKSFPFTDSYADEVLASDILEHFTKEEGEKFLSECYRILKKDGLITIRTHNIFRIFEKFQNDPEVLIHFLYGDTAKSGMLGSHKFAYTKYEIKKILEKLGFLVTDIEEETTNFLIKAKKTEKISFRKLNIAMIQQSPDLGGAEFFMLNLLRKLRIRGHRIVVATDSGKFFEVLKKNDFLPTLIPFKLDVIGNFRGLVKSVVIFPLVILFYLRLLYFYKMSGVDIILMSGFSEKMLVTVLSMIFKIPVFWIEYGPLDGILKRNFYFPMIIYRILKYIPKKVITPTKNTRQDLITSGKLPFSKISVIPCGVEFKSKFRGSKALNKQKIVTVGNVSRLTREKGQQYIIASIPQIIKKNPNVRFVFVGNGPDKDYFVDLVQKLNVGKYVYFTGFVEDVDNHIRSFDVFVFPSTWELEGFGLVAVEAMKHKVPIIANNFGPIKEVVANDGGVLVDIQNKKEFVDAVIKLINTPDIRKKIGIGGYRKAKTNYNIDLIARKYEEIFYEAFYL